MSRGAEGTRRSGGGGRDSDGGASLIGGKGTAQEADSCGRLPPAGINPPIPSIALAPAARVFYLAGGSALSDDDIQDTYTHGARPIEMALD